MKNNIDQYKKEIVSAISKISKDRNLLGGFLKEILTPREFENIAVRLEIVKRLEKGEHHQAIAEDMHLGVATVTRGSREMRRKDGALHKVLKLIK